MKRSLFQNPLPQSVDGFNNAQTMVDAYNNSLNQDAGFAAKHPVVTAVLGGLLGGPGGAIVAPLAAKKNERLRQMKLMENYNNWAKDAIESQKNLDAINQPRNQAQWMQGNVDAAKVRGDVAQDAPDLYSRGLDGQPAVIPAYSPEFMKTYNQGVFADNDAQWGQGVLLNQAGQAYNLPSQALGAQSVQGPDANGALQAGATETGNPPAPARSRPAFISNPEAILNQLGAVTTGGLSQGQERYKFDQEKPKRDAEIEKAIAEGRATDALALYRKTLTSGQQIENKYKPGLLQSQINKNNYRPPSSGRAPSMLETMSPEQRQAYLNKQAGLGPGAADPQLEMLKDNARAATNAYGAGTDEAKAAYEALKHYDMRPYLPQAPSMAKPQYNRMPVRNGAITAPSGKTIRVE